MSNSEITYSLDHMRRIQMSMNILKKHITSTVYDVVSIGYSDLDKFILDQFKNANVSFMVPPEFKPEMENSGKLVTYVDITKEIPVDHREKYDLVIFTEVLEHLLAPDEEVIHNLYLLLKSGGLFLFSVPNIATFANRFRLLFGKNVCWPKNEQIQGVYGGYGHIREYTMKEAIDIMKPFHILESTGISGYRTGFKKLFNILPAGFQNTIVVIGKR